MRIVGLNDKVRKALDTMHTNFHKVERAAKRAAVNLVVRLANYILRKFGQKGLPVVVA